MWDKKEERPDHSQFRKSKLESEKKKEFTEESWKLKVQAIQFL